MVSDPVRSDNVGIAEGLRASTWKCGPVSFGWLAAGRYAGLECRHSIQSIAVAESVALDVGMDLVSPPRMWGSCHIVVSDQHSRRGVLAREYTAAELRNQTCSASLTRQDMSRR